MRPAGLPALHPLRQLHSPTVGTHNDEKTARGVTERPAISELPFGGRPAQGTDQSLCVQLLPACCCSFHERKALSMPKGGQQNKAVTIKYSPLRNSSYRSP